MAIFGRKREDGPGAPAFDSMGAPAPSSAAAAVRDADLGVPPFRPAPKEATTAVSLPPKPSATAPAATAALTTRPMPATASAALAVPGGALRPARPTAADPVERRTLVVGRGISLQGTVSDAERLVVEGTVESEMIQATELFVAQSGVFRGEVQVEDAEIAGLFDGTITVRGSLVIRATGKVNGTARYRKLSVEEGGTLSGRMETLSDAAAAAPAALPPRAVPAPVAVPADAEA
jgi:cytoskeletal protein CcmA (bactofilin family)